MGGHDESLTAGKMATESAMIDVGGYLKGLANNETMGARRPGGIDHATARH
jgi:hypothetical protein